MYQDNRRKYETASNKREITSHHITTVCSSKRQTRQKWVHLNSFISCQVCLLPCFSIPSSWKFDDKSVDTSNWLCRVFKTAKYLLMGKYCDTLNGCKRVKSTSCSQTSTLNYYLDNETLINPLHVSSALMRVIFRINCTLNTQILAVIDLWQLHLCNLGLFFRCRVLLHV